MNDSGLIVQKLLLENDITIITSGAFNRKLESILNELILNDFDKLVQLLYRIDVNENKLKSMLAENTKEDSARIIATLIIERQLQKIKSRAENENETLNENDEERW